MVLNFRDFKGKKIALIFITILLNILLLVSCGQNEATAPKQNDSKQDGSAAEAVKPVELNLGHFMPPMHHMHVDILEPFAQEVAEKTEGRVKIYIYPANELVGPAENYDATVSGVIDIGFTLPAYTPGRFPLTEIMEFPFLFTSAKQANLTMAELIETNPAIKETEYKDVQVLWYGSTDLGHFLTTKPVKTLADLKGLKVRSPSTVGNDVLETLGAIPVTMPVPEIYDAIDRGIVDGTLMGTSALISFKFSEVVDYVLKANMYATPLHMVINKSSWNKISPGDQKIITELPKAFPEKMGDSFEEETEKGDKRAIEAGLAIETLSPEELQKFQKQLEPLIEKWLTDMEGKGLPAREVYEQAKSIAVKYQ